MQTREHAGACGRRRRTAAAGRARTGRTSRPGMSLLELLMVVTIIAILAALLIPGSRHAWANYQATKCKVNLNTLYKALYASSHTLPSATGWTTTVHAAGAANALICPVDTIEVTPDDVFIYDPNKHTDMVFGPDGESTIMQPAQNVTQSNKMTIRDEVPESCVFGNKGFAQPSGMESNSSIFMFTEREDYVLPEDVPVDIGEPGYYTRNYSSTGTTIPSGTPVNCYFLHYDSKENQSAQVYGASLTFRREILGVICLSSTLDATDETLGVTEYDKGRRARGYENNAERVTLSDDRKTFTMNQYKISFPGEDCRVITKASTEEYHKATEKTKQNVKVVDSETGGAGSLREIELEEGQVLYLSADCTSYAMNSQVKPEGSHGKQILLIGYEWSSIAETKDLEAFEMAFLPASQRPVGFPYVPERHYGKVNMLTVEGNVRGVYLHEINPDEDEVEEAIWLP